MLIQQIFTWVFVFLFLSSPVSSESFFYNGFEGLDDSNITLNGAGAKIITAGILRLTNHTSHLVGRGFYPNPIRFKNPTTGKPVSFSTSFVFSIVSEYEKWGGHGLAFVISPTKDLPGAQPRQYLGLLNATDNGNSSNHVFAVEFDTVQDFDFADINDNHVGIDINGMTSKESTEAGFFVDGNSTKQDLNLKSGKKIQAWIDYDSAKPQLNVTLSLYSTKPSMPILSAPVDLSPVFQDFMYVGLSASTGLLVSSHYIFGWSFNMSGQAKSFDLSRLPSIPGVRMDQQQGLIIGVSVSVFVAFIIIVTVGSIYVKKRNKNMDVIEEWEYDVGPHRFSYKELKEATKGFRDEIGFGGSGRVYRGVLPNSKTQVAVKRISQESRQGMREFVSEISIIGRVRHRNLVQLLGWCRRRGDLLIVYDFMANGSLDKYIYDDPKLILTWKERFKIIKGVASGLLYLHEEWEQTVLHRDIKAGNVLLDSELNGRLGDFGLAKSYEHGSNPSTTRVVGTLGYLAPELTRTGKPTTSSDVFAFGALLLEVVCGRRPVEPKALPEELILVDWVWDQYREGALLEVVDSRLKGEFDKVEALVVLKLGLACSSNAPSDRPTMRQVVGYLERELSLPEGLASPCSGDGKGGSGLEFEDYVHSYPPSPCAEKVSTCSAADGEGDIDLEAGLASPPSASGKESKAVAR